MTVNILSMVVVGDRLIVTTDYSDNPVFVYHVDKFKSGEALLAEINRFIINRNARIASRNNVISNLSSDLDIDINIADLGVVNNA